MAKVDAAAILGRLYASQATPDLCRNVWTCPVLARAIFRAGLTSSIRNSEAHPNGEAIVGTIRNRSDGNREPTRRICLEAAATEDASAKDIGGIGQLEAKHRQASSADS